ncbi:acyl-CoA dehydrogenase family protein [Erythrobacter sp. GH1-10]|uniref:acyl-CoA dehydrogenase family protein n=1 Tax=Erythrobacter sp. GH1-10 TaxID=3349334 RepID=UPI0038782067
MDFAPTPRQQAMLDAAEDIMRVHRERQEARGQDENSRFPRELSASLGEAGLLTLWADPDVADPFSCASLVQELVGYHDGTAASILFVNNAASAILSRGCSSPLNRDVLDQACRGKINFSFAVTEPEAGSDVAALQTTAQADGEGFVVNGVKSYATGAADADYILIVALTSTDGPAKGGTSLFLVPGDAAGLTKRKLVKPTGDAHATCKLTLEDVRVPSDHLVGEHNGAWRLLFLGGVVERLLVAAVSVGVAQRAFDQARDFLSERKQFGQSIIEFQAVNHRLADHLSEIEAMRWLTRHAAWSADCGIDAPSRINMAKLFASERGSAIVSDLMRLVGGRGYFPDDPLNLAAREIGLSLFAGGSSEIQRNGIARGLMATPAAMK